MASRSVTWVALAGVVLTASAASAIPISITIEDYDFGFVTDFVAQYQYNGAAADLLTMGAGGTEVTSFRYLGIDGPTDIAGDPVGLYPIWGSASPMIFGGDLELEMLFNGADGPYSSSGDQFDISLTGTPDLQTPSVGFLRITGIVGAPTGSPVTLLEIQFDATSLLARAGADLADQVEGVGTVTKLLGQDVSAEGRTGGVTMQLLAQNSGAEVFPAAVGAAYDPLADYAMDDLPGRVNGNAGIPEPAGLAILLAGAVTILFARRRRYA